MKKKVNKPNKTNGKIKKMNERKKRVKRYLFHERIKNNYRLS